MTVNVSAMAMLNAIEAAQQAQRSSGSTTPLNINMTRDGSVFNLSFDGQSARIVPGSPAYEAAQALLAAEKQNQTASTTPTVPSGTTPPSNEAGEAGDADGADGAGGAGSAEQNTPTGPQGQPSSQQKRVAKAETKLQDKQAAVATAQANFDAAKAAFEAIENSGTKKEVDAARKAMNKAESKLNSAKRAEAAAQKELDNAQKAELKSRERNLKRAENAEKSALKALGRANDRVDKAEGRLQDKQAAVATAQTNYDNAKAAYEAIKDDPLVSDKDKKKAKDAMKKAENKLKQAQRAEASAQKSLNNAKKAQGKAQGKYDQARANTILAWEALHGRQLPGTLEDVRTAEAQIEFAPSTTATAGFANEDIDPVDEPEEPGTTTPTVEPGSIVIENPIINITIPPVADLTVEEAEAYIAIVEEAMDDMVQDFGAGIQRHSDFQDLATARTELEDHLTELETEGQTAEELHDAYVQELETVDNRIQYMRSKYNDQQLDRGTTGVEYRNLIARQEELNHLIADLNL